VDFRRRRLESEEYANIVHETALLGDAENALREQKEKC
jgi:hypothetical protein